MAASVYTAAFVIILCGIPAAALGHGRVRAYWIGFTICGAGFFALATLDEVHDPLQAAHVQREPSLITSHFLLRANEYRPIFRTANSSGDSPHMYTEGVIRIGAKLYAVRDDAANFVRIGNAEFSLLLALAGGALGRRCRGGTEPVRTDPHAIP